MSSIDFLIPSPRSLPADGEFDFWDSDTADIYEKNVKKFGQQWIYTDKSFSYKINRQGYRSNNIEDINLDNYMAVLGCSLTVGIGLALEDTWAYQISQQEDLDLVNAAIPGASNNLIYANFVRLATITKKPKFIIINWTDLTRNFYWDSSGCSLYIVGHKISDNSDWDQSFKQRIIHQDKLIYEFSEMFNQVNLIALSRDIPVWHITNFAGYETINEVCKLLYQYYAGSDPNNVIAHNKFAARDIVDLQVSHPGTFLQHRVITKWNEVRKNYVR